MSFDITFVERPVDDDWDSAMDALEATAEQSANLSAADLARWQQIRSSLAADLPDAYETGGSDVRELTDDATGLQLSIFATEMSLSVPYWSEGDEAERIVGLLRRVTTHVEQVTGLVGYDSQNDCAFLEGEPRHAVDTFDHVRVVLDEHAATPQPSTPPLPPPPPTVPTPSPHIPSKRRWWPFGRS